MSTWALGMVRNRGLERRVEGATPLPGGMTLYIPPGPDGTSIGNNCPLTQYIRMVLTEKKLDYDLVPTMHNATTPAWLIEHYSGTLPALRHRKECYVNVDVIAQYLEFFFPEPSLTVAVSSSSASSTTTSLMMMEEATVVVEGFYPALTRYIKHSSGSSTSNSIQSNNGNNNNNDEEDKSPREALEIQLRALDNYLSRRGDDNKHKIDDNYCDDKSSQTGPYLVGDGTTFTLLDCSLAPKLYSMDVWLREGGSGGNNNLHLANEYPHVRRYMDHVFDRPSFKSTVE